LFKDQSSSNFRTGARFKVRGIDPDLEGKVTNIRDFIIAGSFDLTVTRQCSIGTGQNARSRRRNKISVSRRAIHPDYRGTRSRRKQGDKTSASALKQMILPTEPTVTGIFERTLSHDSEFLLVPLHRSEIYNLEAARGGLAVKTLILSWRIRSRRAER
jgi:hypothetical protein